MQTSTHSNLLLKRSLAAVWHPCTQMKQHESLPLVPVARGKGCWLYDADGRRYLDAVSSWWVNLFGHCEPRINAALTDQLGKLEHVMLAGFSHEPVVELSERLARASGDVLGHCFYASDGAPPIADDKARAQLTPDSKTLLARLATAFDSVNDWSEKPLEEAVRRFAEAENVKLGQVAQPLRVALSGSTASPGIFEVVAILGPAETKARLLAAGG